MPPPVAVNERSAGRPGRTEWVIDFTGMRMEASHGTCAGGGLARRSATHWLAGATALTAYALSPV